MKYLFLLALSLLLLTNCCDSGMPYKELSWQQEYESITNTTLPKEFKIVSNPPFHPGDPLRKTILDLNEKDCKDFYRNWFKSINDTIAPDLFTSSFMDSIYKLIPDRGTFLQRYGKTYGVNQKGYLNHDKFSSTNWLYLIDTSTCRLYCLISYPNEYGHPK